MKNRPSWNFSFIADSVSNFTYLVTCDIRRKRKMVCFYTEYSFIMYIIIQDREVETNPSLISPIIVFLNIVESDETWKTQIRVRTVPAKSRDKWNVGIHPRLYTILYKRVNYSLPSFIRLLSFYKESKHYPKWLENYILSELNLIKMDMYLAWGRDKCSHSLVRKPVGKRPLRRNRIRWEDTIKMYLKDMFSFPRTNLREVTQLLRYNTHIYTYINWK